MIPASKKEWWEFLGVAIGDASVELFNADLSSLSIPQIVFWHRVRTHLYSQVEYIWQKII